MSVIRAAGGPVMGLGEVTGTDGVSIWQGRSSWSLASALEHENIWEIKWVKLTGNVNFCQECVRKVQWGTSLFLAPILRIKKKNQKTTRYHVVTCGKIGHIYKINFGFSSFPPVVISWVLRRGGRTSVGSERIWTRRTLTPSGIFRCQSSSFQMKNKRNFEDKMAKRKNNSDKIQRVWRLRKRGRLIIHWMETSSRGQRPKGKERMFSEHSIPDPLSC